MSSKNKLKEKILSWYDGIFGLDTKLIYDYANFWDEFFLLRPKHEYLSEKIKALTGPKVIFFWIWFVIFASKFRLNHKNAVL